MKRYNDILSSNSNYKSMRPKQKIQAQSFHENWYTNSGLGMENREPRTADNFVEEDLIEDLQVDIQIYYKVIITKQMYY